MIPVNEQKDTFREILRLLKDKKDDSLTLLKEVIETEEEFAGMDLTDCRIKVVERTAVKHEKQLKDLSEALMLLSTVIELLNMEKEEKETKREEDNGKSFYN